MDGRDQHPPLSLSELGERAFNIARCQHEHAAWFENSRDLANGAERILKVFNDVPHGDDVEECRWKVHLIHGLIHHRKPKPCSCILSCNSGYFQTEGLPAS